MLWPVTLPSLVVPSSIRCPEDREEQLKGLSGWGRTTELPWHQASCVQSVGGGMTLSPYCPTQVRLPQPTCAGLPPPCGHGPGGASQQSLVLISALSLFPDT